jgi:hypothetical protein
LILLFLLLSALPKLRFTLKIRKVTADIDFKNSSELLAIYEETCNDQAATVDIGVRSWKEPIGLTDPKGL